MNPITLDSDHEMPIFGVAGRLTHRTVKPGAAPGLFTRQRWISERRPVDGYGAGAYMVAEVRFDDDCNNGHNTFAITAEVRRPGGRDIEAGGCMHEEIARVFPELEPLIKWHLVSADGPMHYVANAVYHAGDRDHYGRRAGEPARFESSIYFGDSPLGHRIGERLAEFIQARRGTGNFSIVGIAHERDPKTYGVRYTLTGYGEQWHECPFRDERFAREFCAGLNQTEWRIERVPVAFSEGKPRDLAAARSVAVWPDATDEELSVEPAELKAALLARLPALLAAFRAELEAAGLAWAPEFVPGVR